MKISMTDTATHTRKIVKPDEVHSYIQRANINPVSKIKTYFKLLNGEIIECNGYEFKKEIEGGRPMGEHFNGRFKW